MFNSLLNTQNYAHRLVICKPFTGKILFTVGNTHTKEKCVEVEKVFWGKKWFSRKKTVRKGVGGLKMIKLLGVYIRNYKIQTIP